MLCLSCNKSEWVRWWIFNEIDVVKLNHVVVIIIRHLLQRLACIKSPLFIIKQAEFIKNSTLNERKKSSLIGLVEFNFESQIFFTYPSAHVEWHSPLCSCNPFTHSVQFIRDTHCVQVCKHRVQIPASMKYPLSHVLTHLLFCSSKLFEHVKQSFSVGPMHVSQVEWHEWQRPLSEYSAKERFVFFFVSFSKRNERKWEKEKREKKNTF